MAGAWASLALLLCLEPRTVSPTEPSSTTATAQLPELDPRPEFAWKDVYVFPNPVKKGVPVFHAELSLPADVVELRVYTITLQLLHTEELLKPTRLESGSAIYEYAWKGASNLPNGVYLLLFRAQRQGFKTLKEMKHMKIAL